MQNDLLKVLNPKQKEAVEFCDSHELVLAGAGSGKTKVLTTKIAYLIDKKQVAPWKILALTFTNKAAREMKERVEKLIGEDFSGMEVSTFHAYGLKFLHRYSAALQKLGYPANFVIFDTGDIRKVVKKILEKLKVDDIFSVNETINRISNAKTTANPITREVYLSDAKMHSVYEEYQKTLVEQGALDFDDLLVLPLHILATDEVVREHERNRLEWILVDEYQDVNRPQYLLLRLLVSGGRKIVVVGDPDQSIYGWRGADMSMILNFEKDFPTSKVVVLDQNYRSTGNILEAANGVIQHNDNRPEKNLWTASSQGSKIEFYQAPTSEDEVEWIAKKIYKLVAEGYHYGEIAILYRMNALSRAFEQSFPIHGIPYRIIKGQSFYERAEVKDVLSMMRLAVNPRDFLSLSRVGNIPTRGLGKKSIEKLNEYIRKMSDTPARDIWNELQQTGGALKGKSGKGAVELACDMLRILECEDSVKNAIDVILNTNGYYEYLMKNYSQDYDEREGNVKEILTPIDDGAGIIEALTTIPLCSDMDTGDDVVDNVNLLTLHAAKGLEFPVVFIVGMEDGIFPSSRSVDEGSLDEERRLCYVGMTRAMEKLYISSSRVRRIFNELQMNSTSKFISEIPDDYINKEEGTAGSGYVFNPNARRKRWHW